MGPPRTRAESARMLAIADASTALSLHPQTLRKYERAGLLAPHRRQGGARHYSSDDMERLALIKHLAEVRRINVAGMNLALALHDELQSMLDAMRSGTPDEALGMAESHFDRVMALLRGE
jgi:MerR family transcriptional regulator, heat shock protein HspR